MKNFYVLTDALNFVEDHLSEPMTMEEIAASCYVSLSSLQKLFRYALHISLKDYVSRRRMTHAAAELVNTDMTVLDIAMKYQYNSHEVFSRAFLKTWETTPSVFRSKWRFTGLFPKIEFQYDGGDITMRRRYDITELYDFLKSRQNTYVLCFDMMGLMAINDTIGTDAGDKAILECLRRIDEAATDDMLLFRIGGDEFVLVTGYDDAVRTNTLAKQILQQNGQPIYHNGKEIPIGMRAGGVLMKGGNIRYSELFAELNASINDTKDKNQVLYIVE